jgi:hypothetical protein
MDTLIQKLKLYVVQIPDKFAIKVMILVEYIQRHRTDYPGIMLIINAAHVTDRTAVASVRVGDKAIISLY